MIFAYIQKYAWSNKSTIRHVARREHLYDITKKILESKDSPICHDWEVFIFVSFYHIVPLQSTFFFTRLKAILSFVENAVYQRYYIDD